MMAMTTSSSISVNPARPRVARACQPAGVNAFRGWVIRRIISLPFEMCCGGLDRTERTTLALILECDRRKRVLPLLDRDRQRRGRRIGVSDRKHIGRRRIVAFDFLPVYGTVPFDGHFI